MAPTILAQVQKGMEMKFTAGWSLSRITIVFVLILAFGSQATAIEDRDHVVGSFSGVSELFRSSGLGISSASRYESQLASPISLSGKVAGIGRFRISFSAQRHMKFVGKTPNVALLRGAGQFIGRKGKHSSPVAATVTPKKKGYRLDITILNEGVGRAVQPGRKLVTFAVHLSAKAGRGLEPSRVSFSRVKQLGVHRGCGTAHPLGSPSVNLNGIEANSNVATTTILAQADTRWSDLSPNVGSDLASLYNMVNLWYERDLGQRLDVTIDSTPQSYQSYLEYDFFKDEAFAFSLHEEMNQKVPYQQRSQSLHNLFTGQRGFGDLQNLAGVVNKIGYACDKKFALGVVIHWNDTEGHAVTLAHEIGHTLGASHDDNEAGGSINTGYIMASGVNDFSNGWVNEFSQRSKGEFASHLSSNPSCYGQGDGGSGGGDSGGGDDGSSGGGGSDDTGGDDQDDVGGADEFALEASGRMRPYRRGRHRGRRVNVKFRLSILFEGEYYRPTRRELRTNNVSVAVSCSDSETGTFTELATKVARRPVVRFRSRTRSLSESGYYYCKGRIGSSESNVLQVLEVPSEESEGDPFEFF